MKKLILLVSVLCGAIVSVQGHALTPLSLKDAIIKAQTVSPDAQISGYQVELAQFQNQIATAKTGFQVGLQGEIGASYVDFTADDTTLIPNQIGIGATKDLFTSGKNEAAIARSALQIDASKYRDQQTRNTVGVQAALAYGNLWFAEKTVDVRAKKVETLRFHLREANARFAQGENTKTDVALAEARLAGAEAELAGAKAGLSAAKAALARLSGVLDPATTAGNIKNAVGFENPTNTDSDLLFANYPGLKAAKANARASRAGIREAEGAFGPKVTLDLSAGTAQDSFFFFKDRINETKALLKFSMPLYTSGMKKASVSAAKIQSNLAQARITDLALKLNERFTSLRGQLSANQAALSAATRAVEAANARVAGSRKEYEAGLKTFVNLMDAEDERRLAEVIALAAERDIFVTKVYLADLTNTFSKIVQ